MAKHDELTIEERDDRRWKMIKPHAERASAIEDSKALAIRRAKELAAERDIKLKGLDGKFTPIQKGK